MSLVDLGGDARMQRTRLLVLDFEGLTPAGRSPEPIEVAATKLEYRNGALVETDRFESLNLVGVRYVRSFDPIVLVH